GTINVKRGDKTRELGKPDTSGNSDQSTDGSGCTLLQTHWAKILCITLLFSIFLAQQ
ncbi:hypothetical protein Ahia01_000885300, partial [Argonauta hians]